VFAVFTGVLLRIQIWDITPSLLVSLDLFLDCMVLKIGALLFI